MNGNFYEYRAGCQPELHVIKLSFHPNLLRQLAEGFLKSKKIKVSPYRGRFIGG